MGEMGTVTLVATKRNPRLCGAWKKIEFLLIGLSISLYGGFISHDSTGLAWLSLPWIRAISCYLEANTWPYLLSRLSFLPLKWGQEEALVGGLV